MQVHARYASMGWLLAVLATGCSGVEASGPPDTPDAATDGLSVETSDAVDATSDDSAPGDAANETVPDLLDGATADTSQETLGDTAPAIDDSHGDAPFALADLPAVLGAALCELIDSCSLDFGSSRIEARFLRGPDCATHAAQLFRDVLQDHTRRVASGLIGYDGAAARACVTSLSCEDFMFANNPFFGRCRDVFDGKVGEGGACNSNVECAGEARCGGEQCPGACEPAPALGSDCGSDFECATAGGSMNVDCSYFPPDLGVCREVVVASPAASNAGCGVELFAGKVTHTPCAQGLWCRYNGDSSRGSCKPVLGAGASCDSSRQCSDDLLCFGTCTRFALATAGGDACSRGLEPTITLCNPMAGVYCGEDGRCHPAGRLGDSCNAEISGSCDSSHFCMVSGSVFGTCIAPLADGSDCYSNAQCASGVCGGETGECVKTACY